MPLIVFNLGIRPDELRQELGKLLQPIKDLIMATKKDVTDAIAANSAAQAAAITRLGAQVDVAIKLIMDLRNSGGGTASDLDEVLTQVRAAGVTEAADDKAVEDRLDAALASGTISSLSMLLVSVGTLSPAFDPAVLSYTVDEAADVSAVMLAPTSTDPNAKISVAGTPVGSGSASDPIAVAPGSNTVGVSVTSADGSASTSYTVVINVATA